MYYESQQTIYNIFEGPELEAKIYEKEGDRLHFSYYAELQNERQSLQRGESGETNGKKNRKHPATARSGRADSRNRGAKRDLGYVEVRPHRG
jgi:hypothetical protein